MSSDVQGAPSAKEKKYDRQLRLWAANGQQALEESHICLINATAAGTEILKNLILPSIGQYTIIDSAKVTEADLGVNFFLDESCLDKDRAKAACELLQELNPDVKGNYVVDDIANLIADPAASLSKYTVVVVTGDVPPNVLLQLDKYLYPRDVPFFVVKSVGFAMSCRVVVREHCIIESHPDDTVDLRLLRPFEELKELYTRKTEFLASGDKDKMSDHEFGHVPYVLVLLKYLDIWKEGHDGKYPDNYKEKNELKAMIRKGMRTPDDENFEEAIAAVLKNLNAPSIPSSTRAIFEDDKCKDGGSDEPFWVMARAVKAFTYEDNDGLLPLPGGLPDMKAESSGYIELQNVFKRKARSDVDKVFSRCPANSVSREDVDTWCKHAGYVKLIRGRSLNESYESPKHPNVDDADSLVHYHIALRAYEDFRSKHSRAPGSLNDVELDEEAMMETVRQLGGTADTENAVKEVVRAGGGEMHNVSSLAGGMVAQEIIKAVTKQYILMDNTVVFDGVGSKSEVFVL